MLNPLDIAQASAEENIVLLNRSECAPITGDKEL